MFLHWCLKYGYQTLLWQNKKPGFVPRSSDTDALGQSVRTVSVSEDETQQLSVSLCDFTFRSFKNKQLK